MHANRRKNWCIYLNHAYISRIPEFLCSVLKPNFVTPNVRLSRQQSLALWCRVNKVEGMRCSRWFLCAHLWSLSLWRVRTNCPVTQCHLRLHILPFPGVPSLLIIQKGKMDRWVNCTPSALFGIRTQACGFVLANVNQYTTSHWAIIIHCCAFVEVVVTSIDRFMSLVIVL